MLQCCRNLYLILLTAGSLQAQSAPDSSEIVGLLHKFLRGVSNNDASVHEWFWADDLMYTRSAGVRTTKAEILRDVRSAPPRQAGEPTTAYAARDIRVRQYGATAVVSFRLVGETITDSVAHTLNYFNTGTFLERAGKWEVVAWQATKVAKPDEVLQKEISALVSAFWKDFAAADTTGLRSMVSQQFICISPVRSYPNRTEWFHGLAAERLKYNFVRDSLSVFIEGNLATSSGTLRGTGSSPADSRFTITLVASTDDWKVISLNLNRR